MRLLTFALVSTLLATLALAQKPPVRAVIVSNTRYAKLAEFRSAEPDANLISAALTAVGAPDLKRLPNLTSDRLFEEIEDRFVASVRPGDVVLLYFSGYAVQADGQNYLLGIDFDPASTEPLRDRAYLLDRIRTKVQEHDPQLVLLFVDGAYDQAALTVLPGYAPGLAAARPIRNGMVLYSAAQDQNALRPATPTSPLASSLADALKVPGLSMLDLMTRISARMAEATSGRQRPYLNPDYSGSFRFTEPPPKIEETPRTVTQVVTQVVHDGPQRRQHPDDREYYVLIPAGKFRMGCATSASDTCEPQEKPQHEVAISKPFWLGETEVSVAGYRRFTTMQKVVKMPRAPIGFDFRNESLPIVMVPWEDAHAYCQWLGGELPSEAQWEYAARAGQDAQNYPMGEFAKSRDVANFRGTSGNDVYDFVAPVRKFDKNPFSLHDMSGNVWEWTRDAFSATYYSESPVADPPGPSAGKEHVIRGGSFDSDPLKHLRLSYRDKSAGAQNKIGFRCVLPDSPEIRARLR